MDRTSPFGAKRMMDIRYKNTFAVKNKPIPMAITGINQISVVANGVLLGRRFIKT
jgi:hypothetical protein